MKTTLICIVLFACLSAKAAFTEFYCDNTAGAAGSNVFSGSTSSPTPTYSSFHGNWDSSTIFTPTDGSTPANTVSAGMWASVYPDGEIITKFVSRVSSVDAGVNGSIHLTASAAAGTPPALSTGTTTIRVGGAWHGPGTGAQVGGSGGSTNYFPFDFVVQALTNTSSQVPFVNIKGGTTYTITNTMLHTKVGPVWFMGYTNTPRDGGFAVFDGGNPSTSFEIIRIDTGGHVALANLVVQNNGSGGSACGVTNSNGANVLFYRLCANNIRGSGFYNGGSGCVFLEDEAYACNAANTANFGAFQDGSSSARMFRCTAHHNVGGANASGFGVIDAIIVGCGAWYNTSSAVKSSSGTGSFICYGCNFYSNGVDAVQFTTGSGNGINIFENNNFFRNKSYALESQANIFRLSLIDNCLFGSGTQTNLLGSVNSIYGAGSLSSVLFANTNTFTANSTPWMDPDNGNFTLLDGTIARATGNGEFVQNSVNSPTNTVSHPDIGAVQMPSTNSGFAAGYAQ